MDTDDTGEKIERTATQSAGDIFQDEGPGGLIIESRDRRESCIGTGLYFTYHIYGSMCRVVGGCATEAHSNHPPHSRLTDSKPAQFIQTLQTSRR